MTPEEFRKELERTEEEKVRKGFERIWQVMELVTEKINLTAEETSPGLVLRLKTTWADLGIHPDSFAHPEVQIGFGEQSSPRLVYKDRDLVVPDFYSACSLLLEDLVLREKGSHRRQIFGSAEHAIGKFFQRGIMKSYFFKVYPMCVKFAPHLPSFEAFEEKDLPKIRRMLIEEEQKLEIGGTYRLNGVGFFKNIQWDDKGIRTYALDPVETYETGDFHSMQFREDLERYALQAKK